MFSFVPIVLQICAGKRERERERERDEVVQVNVPLEN